MPTQQEIDELNLQFHRRFMRDWVGFIEWAFGKHLRGGKVYPKQRLILEAVCKGVDRVSVRSGRGKGKSAVASWVLICHILFRLPQKTLVTAPSAPQLFDALWAEARMWIARLPEFLSTLLHVTSERIELVGKAAESFITARTARADQPESMQGVHSEYVLVLVDEASGVDDKVMEALFGSLQGKNRIMLLMSNSTRGSGFFYETHHKFKDDWLCVHITQDDEPAMDPAFVRMVANKFGEDSSAYYAQVLGEFPRTDDNTCIPLYLVQGALNRDVADDNTREIWGLDVARFGDDATCLVKRAGRVVREPPRRWHGKDTMQTVGLVKAEYDSVPVKPAEILVDVIGVGAGVLDRLRELGLPARGINVSESPAMGDTYRNLRAELWFRCKEWLARLDCKLPKDEELEAELVTVRYTINSGGKVQVESKDEMKKRGRRSPDSADALMLTFAGDAFVALTGYQSTWDKPIRRNLVLA